MQRTQNVAFVAPIGVGHVISTTTTTRGGHYSATLVYKGYF
ncbi:hypothetical protein VPHK45_0029 [Vibrio phage K45]